MTYDVMLTFDLENTDESKRQKVNEILDEELKFKKDWRAFDCNFVKNESSASDDQKHQLPDNIYLAKFPDENYSSKEELAVSLRDLLTKIFTDLDVKGNCVFLIDKTETADEINGSAFEF